MIEERILTAVERIDGAMSRIEASARRPVGPTPAAELTLAAGPAPAEGLGAALGAGLAAGFASDSELRVRHDTMRGRVKDAIAELDALISNG